MTDRFLVSALFFYWSVCYPGASRGLSGARTSSPYCTFSPEVRFVHAIVSLGPSTGGMGLVCEFLAFIPQDHLFVAALGAISVFLMPDFHFQCWFTLIIYLLRYSLCVLSGREGG